MTSVGAEMMATARAMLESAEEIPVDSPSAYACGVCDDVGWVNAAAAGATPRLRRCECALRAATLRRLERAGVPGKYSRASFDNFQSGGVDGSVAMASRLLDRAAFEYLSHPEGQGFLLTGTCGVGKTHLAVAALRAVVLQYGVNARFWDMADLLTEIKRSYQRSRVVELLPEVAVESESAVLREFARMDVLVVDELGGERLTEWSDSEVRLLLNARYNASGHRPKLTIFTTNFPNLGPGEGRGVETLGDRIGARMFSRLQEMCRAVEMRGRDYRRGRLEGVR